MVVHVVQWLISVSPHNWFDFFILEPTIRKRIWGAYQHCSNSAFDLHVGGSLETLGYITPLLRRKGWDSHENQFRAVFHYPIPSAVMYLWRWLNVVSSLPF